MMFRLPNLLHEAINRHGGGWAGIRSITSRSLNVVRALGWRGLIQRIRASQSRATHAPHPAEAVSFPAAVPIEEGDFSVGIIAHVFYSDLLSEMAGYLDHMPVPFTLMISVVDKQTEQSALLRFGKNPNISALHVRVVPNRGRDLAPLLVTFREEVLPLDIICHIHTKKSLYTGTEQNSWRRYLMDSLLGSKHRITWILGMFKAMPELGMVYPENFRTLPLWAHTWLGNNADAHELGQRLGIRIDTAAYIDYPAGSMFWVRTVALRPLFDLELPLTAFPVECGQTDGTLQHALERMLGLLVRHQQMVLGIMSPDGSNNLASEGSRNWLAHFRLSVADKVAQAAINARLVSFDLFDTLLLRPFLHPSGARAYLAFLVEQQFGVQDFARLRENSESAARVQTGRDVDLDTIYLHLAKLPELRGIPVDKIRELELATEHRLLRPRQAILDVAIRLARAGTTVIAVSDMYFRPKNLRDLMPASVSAVLERIHVSCDNGWRKDNQHAWQQLPQTEKVPAAQWLHIGDNEHSDIQIPQSLGFLNPVHVLRPSVMLDVVPALRPLRMTTAQSDRWEDQLWIGLIANRFSELGDYHPSAFNESVLLEDPAMFGYAVLGPLVLDYVIWLARLSLDNGNKKILFLSREGYFFRRVFQLLQTYVPSLLDVDNTYLLASRRGINTPSLRAFDDLASVFSSPYTGTLRNLAQARLGGRIASALAVKLGNAVVDAEVFLPEQQATVLDLLRPVVTIILSIAGEERSAYLQYWEEKVGDSSAIVADIGYAGTIQSRLTRLTGKPLGGGYWSVKTEIAQVQALGGWALGRFYDARAGGATPPVMRHHLLLETILTSPDGQFSHFEAGPAGLKAIYSPNTSKGPRWDVVQRIHGGAEQFVRDVCAITQGQTLEVSFNNDLVQRPLDCVATGRWQLGTWAASLLVEDNYTGRGQVAAAAT